MALPTLHGVGRIVDDPELRFTPSGKAVVKLRIAFSDRKKDENGTWVDGDKAFLDVSVWDQEAENIAESLSRGLEVSVSGRLKQREYTTRDGEKRTVYELAFATVAPTLKYATAAVKKMQRSGGAGQAQPAPGGADDPWASSGPGRGQADESAPPF